MEKFAYLKDIPRDFVMNPDDTIVIGKKTLVNGETRYIAKTVDAVYLISAMTDTVLEGADLPSHLTQMQQKIDEAQGFAEQAESSATLSEQSNQNAADQAQLSESHAKTAEQFKDESAQLKMMCQQHEEASQSYTQLSQRNAEAAGQSEAKAQEYTDICEGFAGGLVSVLTLNMINLTHSAKLDGIA
ncbi:hypothetical protein [Vibrio alginolyticus]|uniref:hypothetical protein n=1 Tax=Vibrio alginolyticus TaxID=663 RepID=UPI0035C6B531